MLKNDYSGVGRKAGMREFSERAYKGTLLCLPAPLVKLILIEKQLQVDIRLCCLSCSVSV